MRAQVAARPVGVLFGLELTVNPFSHHPSYRGDRQACRWPSGSRACATRRSARGCSADEPDERRRARPVAGRPGTACYPDGRTSPDYEPTPETSIAAHRRRARASIPEEVALDHMLTAKRRARHALPAVPELRRGHPRSGLRRCCSHDCAVPGLSDGGAHVGMICDGSFPTTSIAHWTRDRTRGPEAAAASRWSRLQTPRHRRDRRPVRPRPDRSPATAPTSTSSTTTDLTLHAPEVAYDLPAGGRRLIQRAERLHRHHRRRRGHLPRRRAHRRPARPPAARRAAPRRRPWRRSRSR